LSVLTLISTPNKNHPLRLPTISEASETSSPRRWGWCVWLILIVALVAGIRLRLLNLPLERDEGEYAYMGQLILQGVPPYAEAYNMKWPGTYAAYAILMAVFGQTTTGIHLGLLFVSLTTTWMIFLLTRRVAGNGAGVVAVATYGLLSIIPSTLGLAAHATHFVILFALGGILLLQNFNERTSTLRLFSVGFWLGLATLMKQSGVAFVMFAIFWLAWQEWASFERNKKRLLIRLLAMGLGVLLPILLTLVILAVCGVFDRFWLWTVQYARAYAGRVGPQDGIELFLHSTRWLWSDAGLLWLFALAGLIFIFRVATLRPARMFVVGFALCSFLAVCPGLYFRPHYFLQLVPAAALMAGVTFHSLPIILPKTLPPTFRLIPGFVFGIMALSILLQLRHIFFQLNPAQVSRALYVENPFPEAVEIGRYLASNAAADSRIAVLGSEPQIYFYSRRRSASGYIYTYPLVENQPYALQMQQDIIRQIEQTNPEYIVFVNVHASWLSQRNSPPLIFQWFERYKKERLEMVAWIEITSLENTVYEWTLTEEKTNAQSPHWIAIFRDRNRAR
jgi:hypothetical protein